MPNGSGVSNRATGTGASSRSGAAKGIGAPRLPTTYAAPLVTSADDELIRYVPQAELPGWMRLRRGEMVGATFALDIIEPEDRTPRLVIHAWPEFAPPRHVARPATAVSEAPMFPITVSGDEDAGDARAAFYECAASDLVEQGLALLTMVAKRTWSFVCVRSDGTTANWPSATRAKEPIAHLLDWADTVGGRLRSSWQKLAAVNQDRREVAPICYAVRLRSGNRTVWENGAYALSVVHAAEAVADKLPLAKALNWEVDRITVREPDGTTWQAFVLEDLYSAGEMQDALAELSPAAVLRRAAAQRGRSIVTASDAQILTDRDWLGHPFASFKLWRAAREQQRQVRARVA